MGIFDKHKINKLYKEADKEDKRLDNMEDLNQARIEVAERKKEQQKRRDDQQWLSDDLKKRDLEMQIGKAKGEMWVLKDKLANIVFMSQKEIAYLQKQPDSPGKRAKLNKLETKWKNAYYALALVQQTLERLEEMPEEHEWSRIMRDLTNGYKTVNAISVGSDWITRLSLWWQKNKFELGHDISAVSMERYFMKPIDELLQEESIDKGATELLVAAKHDDLAGLSKQDIEDAARNGVFLTVQPLDAAYYAEEAQEQLKNNGYKPDWDLNTTYDPAETRAASLNALRNMEAKN